MCGRISFSRFQEANKRLMISKRELTIYAEITWSSVIRNFHKIGAKIQKKPTTFIFMWTVNLWSTGQAGTTCRCLQLWYHFTTVDDVENWNWDFGASLVRRPATWNITRGTVAAPNSKSRHSHHNSKYVLKIWKKCNLSMSYRGMG